MPDGSPTRQDGSLGPLVVMAMLARERPGR
jgi:hypothetical protein